MDNTQKNQIQDSLHKLLQARDLGIQINEQYEAIEDAHIAYRDLVDAADRLKIPKLVDDLTQLAKILDEKHRLEKEIAASRKIEESLDDQLRALKVRFAELVPGGVWIKCGENGVGYFGGSLRDPVIYIELWSDLIDNPEMPKFANADSLA